MKVVMWVVALVVVGAASWFIWKQTAGPGALTQTPPTQQQEVQQPVQQQKTGGLSTTGNTDGELDTDMTQIDGQIDTTASAQSAASQTDQPVKQTE